MSTIARCRICDRRVLLDDGTDLCDPCTTAYRHGRTTAIHDAISAIITGHCGYPLAEHQQRCSCRVEAIKAVSDLITADAITTGLKDTPCQ